MDITLNKTNYREIAVAICFFAVAVTLLVCCGLAFAAGGGTFIGSGANKLLADFATIVALAAIGVGIFQIVKGRMVMGIAVMVIGGIIYAFCKSPEVFGKVGKSILGIFGF